MYNVVEANGKKSKCEIDTQNGVKNFGKIITINCVKVKKKHFLPTRTWICISIDSEYLSFSSPYVYRVATKTEITLCNIKPI